MADAIQAAVGSAMKGRQGCVVALDGVGRTIAVWRPDLAKTLASAPGSAVKPFTLRALLPLRPVPVACRGGTRVDGRELRCTHLVSPAPLDAEEALAVSCNAWFAESALLLRPDQLANSLRWGGADVRAVSTREELQMQALGMQRVLFTPHAMAAGFRKLALEGNPAIRAGLERAVSEGTARAASPGGLPVAGKTGTTREGCWFAGWAPSGSARIVVAVYLQTGRGALDAAPVAGEVFAAWRDSPRS
jgi:cell division protein FtsI/penicillin-binding protein 2